MIARYGAFLYRLSRMMSEMSHALASGDEALAKFISGLTIDKDKDLRDLGGKGFFELFDEFGLKLSRLSIDKYLLNMSHVNDRASMKAFVEELDGRLRDELESVWFMHITDRAATLYNHPRKGWETIIARFPDIVMDLEEANKCFALSRYAASVFHTLQIIEYGLLELGTFINVSDPKSGWTAVSNELKRIVNKKRELLSDFERSNFVFIEQLQATVEALKNAWRNKISHAQGKLTLMTADFTPEVAEEILVATRAFMRRLLEGLPSQPSK